MITTVYAGVWGEGGDPIVDPCHVLAQVTVMHGRGGFGEQGQASSATVVIEHPPGSMPTWKSGDILRLEGPHGRTFSGRIVERSLGHVDDPDGTRWGQFTVTAAGALAALGIRKIGDVPWPQETGTDRAVRILAAARVPYDIDGTTDLEVLARDVDAQPAGGLLDDLAQDTGAAVFDTPEGAVIYQPLSGRNRPVVPYMWSDFTPADTWDDFDPALTWNGDPPSIAEWPSPTSNFPVILPCTAVLWEPEWRSSEATVINHVRVGYGTSNPQATVELTDAASILQHENRYLYLGTQLATEADANARTGHILTTQAVERWQIGDITVALDQLDPATYEACLRLTCGDHVTLQGLPQPAPAIDWTGIVEGWTFTQWADGGVIQEQMVLTLSDPLLSLAVMRWDDYPGTYLWSDHPTDLTWDGLFDVDVLEAA
jgi:hypothetical protein